MELFDRLMTHVKINQKTGCWEWQASTRNGYARAHVGGRQPGAHNISVHRFMYEHLRGPIPDGLKIDHLCRVLHCVNPTHLEVVTQRENIMRGVGEASIHAKKTHCENGHPLSGDNLAGGKFIESRGWRICKTCKRRYGREGQKRRKLGIYARKAKA